MICVVCISLSSKFLPESTGEKNCENWSIFSENNGKSTIAYFLAHPVHTSRPTYVTRAYQISSTNTQDQMWNN